MAEKSSRRSQQRSRLAKNFLKVEELQGKLFDGLTLAQILGGLGIALVITAVLVGYQFQSIPNYEIGDIADRTIEAPHDFTVEDQEATSQKQAEIINAVPVVFSLDLRENSRLESELRSAFAVARRLIHQERQALQIPQDKSLPNAVRAAILDKLAESLPQFGKDNILNILLQSSFSPELENQMVRVLQESMKDPGVVLNRDHLLSYQDRGIILRNTITGEEKALDYWANMRDLEQAREDLRQQEGELVLLSNQEKRTISDFLASWIVPNIRYSEQDTRALESMALRDLDPVLIQVKKGKTVVRAGDEITAKQLMQLNVLKKLKQPRRVVAKFVGIFLIVGFFLYVLWHYFVAHQTRHKEIQSRYLLLSLVFITSLIVTKAFLFFSELLADNLVIENLQNPIHFYLVAPLALGAVLIILLVDVQIAILFSLMLSIFIALMTSEISLAIYTLASSLTAIYILNQYRERAAIIKAGLIIGLVNVFIALALQLYSTVTEFQWIVFLVRSGAALLSGVFAAMLASLLLPVLESLFKITTDIKLLELSNLNKPILRRLAVEAPGTYHHSIIVGTLAEAAAEAIAANPLLVRVGAYYHDIGKLNKPAYYVENQIYCPNKHENLSPSMSSLILTSHVKDGIALAEEIDMVPQVRDLIPQHHGTRLMTFFYQKAKDAADEKNGHVSEDDFRYPGPKPQSKEAAILMLADQVEAASRTLQEPTASQIRALITRLIQSTIQDGQFDECDITMKELDQITRAFERILTGMYHHRIEYPGFEFNKRLEEERPESHRIQ
ncbi:MAG: HD family phosphohydrolase [Acidobacteriota bacterium]